MRNPMVLQLNGRELAAEEVDAAEIVQSVAAGKLTEDELGAWIHEHSRGNTDVICHLT
jgi:prophage maintenance system killer protein